MTAPQQHEVIVIGAGIVGLATALALTERGRRSVLVLEAEAQPAQHQTGHNSGVIHAGLSYESGSLKARLCAAGREALYAFCAERGIRHERCGKLVLATSPDEVARLGALEERGRTNGLTDLTRLDPDEIRALEPHAAGLAALHVPETGVVDFVEVARAMVQAISERGGEVRPGAPAVGFDRDDRGIIVRTPADRCTCRLLIACAGLQADRVARRAGVDPGLSIVPIRGEYRTLTPRAAALVRHLIYPVPDPQLPFLGVHLTRTITGAVEVGPSAVLSLARHGYRRGALSLRDVTDMLADRRCRRFARARWRAGLPELGRALRRRALLRAARRMVPDLQAGDLGPRRCGIRAQAIDAAGRLIDDFHIVESDRMLHVMNAPSPAATASLAIGRHLAERAEAHLD